MSTVDDHTPAKREQLELLHDPLRFVHEAWDALTGSGPLDLIMGTEAPGSPRETKNRATDLVRLAARTPGADIDRALGRLDDAANDLATHVYAKGMEMGAVLEGLRRGLVAVYHSPRAPEPWIERDRAELDRAEAEVLPKVAAD